MVGRLKYPGCLSGPRAQKNPCMRCPMSTERSVPKALSAPDVATLICSTPPWCKKEMSRCRLYMRLSEEFFPIDVMVRTAGPPNGTSGCLCHSQRIAPPGDIWNKEIRSSSVHRRVESAAYQEFVPNSKIPAIRLNVVSDPEDRVIQDPVPSAKVVTRRLILSGSRTGLNFHDVRRKSSVAPVGPFFLRSAVDARYPRPAIVHRIRRVL